MAEYYMEEGGVHFDPDNEELIREYLIPKSRGEPCRYGGFIVDMDVYAKVPWLLDHTNEPFFKEGEWYYFATRTQISEKKVGVCKKSKRKIAGDNDGGVWRANAKKNITDRETGEIIGVKRTLAFIRSNNNNKKMQRREDSTSCAVVPGSDSSWHMAEYTLPERDNKFQETVLCKIHEVKKPSKKKEDHHEASSSYHLGSSSSSEQQPINVDHESVVASSSSEQQPINGAQHHDPVIPQMGSEQSIDQVVKTSCPGDAESSATVKERNEEESPCENLGSEKDNQLLVNAFLVCLGSQETDEETIDWLQEDYPHPSMTVAGSGFPEEKPEDILIYDVPPWFDEDLLAQFAAIRPKESSPTLVI